MTCSKTFPTGFISETLQNTKPYQLRRSSGELQIVPYQATDRAMRADYEYVLERNIAPGNVHYHEITVKAGAQLQLFGELFGGYLLQGPATVSVNGRLCIAHNEESALLAEEGLLSNVEVEVNTGSAALYVCDRKALVLVYSAGEPGVFTIGLPEEELATERVSRDIALLKRVSKDTGKCCCCC